MWLILFRVFMVALLTQAGYVYSPVPGEPWAGALLGLVAALGIINLEIRLRMVPAHQLVGGLVGGVTGLVGARLLWSAITGLDLVAEHFIHSFLIVFLVYMGLVMGTRKGEWFEPARIIAAFKDSSKLHLYKILDTSVIIDGRIADICETGFLEGTLVAPQFVLRELQQVADSSDSMKRNRGRRGLDILAKIQKMSGIHVEIVETDFPEIREVDLKLIELARRMSGKIVTNDFNLNKVAQLRGVPVLNINELANSLKPVVLPGEVLRVFVNKEGKESGQGVAYLDDGTMVVVDQGRKAIGRTIEVTVTSVLQTTAGKMIFCRGAESSVPSEDSGRQARFDRGERTDRMAKVGNGGSYRRDERFGLGEGPTPAMPRTIEGPSHESAKEVGSGATPLAGTPLVASLPSDTTPASGLTPASAMTPASGIIPIPLSVEHPHKAD